MIDKIIQYEHDELPEDQIIELFQELIDSGLAWQLQGHYGRMARSLIEMGYCTDTHGVLKFGGAR